MDSYSTYTLTVLSVVYVGLTWCRNGLGPLSLLYRISLFSLTAVFHCYSLYTHATYPVTADRHLSCFQVLPVVRKAAGARLNGPLGGSMPFLLLRISELTGAWGACMVSSGRHYQIDFPRRCTVLCSQAMGESLLLPNLVSHCNFSWCFLDGQCREAPFHMPMSHLVFSATLTIILRG